MKNYSSVIKIVVRYALVVCCAFGLSHPSYGQGRSLTKTDIDAIVTPTLAQCNVSPGIATADGQVQNARLDPNSIIPSTNMKEFPADRVARTMNGMWHGRIIGSPLDSKYEKSKEGNVDYFWIVDAKNNEGLIIALRNGKDSTAGMAPVANAPKISYLICAHEGYIPSVEKGSEIHEFVKVSNSVAEAPLVLAKATGVKFQKGVTTLSDLWNAIVGSGYFQSLPAVAFAGGFFKPMQIALVPSAVGQPAEVSMSWKAQYYGGGTTWIKFTPGVPMTGVEYTQFVGTSATAGDYLVASLGNGKLSKVEAATGGSYDLSFDSVSLGPLQP